MSEQVEFFDIEPKSEGAVQAELRDSEAAASRRSRALPGLSRGAVTLASGLAAISLIGGLEYGRSQQTPTIEGLRGDVQTAQRQLPERYQAGLHDGVLKGEAQVRAQDLQQNLTNYYDAADGLGLHSNTSMGTIAPRVRYAAGTLYRRLSDGGRSVICINPIELAHNAVRNAVAGSAVVAGDWIGKLDGKPGTGLQVTPVEVGPSDIFVPDDAYEPESEHSVMVVVEPGAVRGESYALQSFEPESPDPQGIGLGDRYALVGYDPNQ